VKRFSHSSIESYKKCPAQFKFRYIDRIRKSDESIEAFLGKRIHEALEYLYNEILAGRIPFFDHVIDEFNAKWNENWHNRIGIFRKQLSPEYYRTLGEDCIARYYRQNAPFEEPVKGNEIQIEFDIDGSGNYPIKGIIDRVNHDKNGNWEIHDYKSGKRALTQKQADEDTQLALYQIGLISIGKEIETVKLVWHFLQKGIRVESFRTEKQLQQLTNNIINQIDKIRSKINNGGEFSPKKSILCNWCYCWEECPVQEGTNPCI